jgi:hypothetical protein
MLVTTGTLRLNSPASFLIITSLLIINYIKHILAKKNNLYKILPNQAKFKPETFSVLTYTLTSSRINPVMLELIFGPFTPVFAICEDVLHQHTQIVTIGNLCSDIEISP